MSWWVSLLFSLPIWAHSAASVVGSYTANIEINRSWVHWDGSRAVIRSDLVCMQELELRLYDVRGKPWLRSSEKDLELTCVSEIKGRPLRVHLSGKAEWLQPRDFNGWLIGDRDLLRLSFGLRVPESLDPENKLRLQETYGQEILSEDLWAKSFIFRVSPPDYLRVRCYQGVCENEGLDIVFRANVELKKNLPFN